MMLVFNFPVGQIPMPGYCELFKVTYSIRLLNLLIFCLVEEKRKVKREQKEETACRKGYASEFMAGCFATCRTLRTIDTPNVGMVKERKRHEGRPRPIQFQKATVVTWSAADVDQRRNIEGVYRTLMLVLISPDI